MIKAGSSSLSDKSRSAPPANPASGPIDLRRRKLQLVVKIMVVGMICNALWYTFTNYLHPLPYPYNTFLFPRVLRFSDLMDAQEMVRHDNPYLYSSAIYLPFAWVLFHPFHYVDRSLLTILCFSIFAGLLLVLTAIAMRPVIVRPWRCAFLSLLLIIFSYPVLSCFDRGNLEIVAAALIAGSLYFFSQRQPLAATLCLAMTNGIKIYPVLLLAILARQHAKWALLCVGTAVVLSLFSLWSLSLSLGTFLSCYSRNLAIYTDFFVYQNLTVSASASPWNALKLLLLMAGEWHLIAPIDFDYRAPAIRIIYTVYSSGMTLLAEAIACYAGFFEKNWKRGAMVLLLFLCIAVAGGGDYRMIYAGMAAILLILDKEVRPHDWTVLVLLALVQVPKKFIIFQVNGTFDGYADASSEVLIDPILILGAMFLLLYGSRSYVAMPWARLRFRRMIRQLIPVWAPASPAKQA